MTLIENKKAKKMACYEFLKNSLKTADFEVYQLAGDASVRKYYRIISNGKSYVLMDWEPFSPNLDEYPLLSVLRHFEKHSVQTPKIVDSSPQDGFLLQEDLGDLTLERKFWENQNQELIIPYYKLALDELIKIHYHATLDYPGQNNFPDKSLGVKKMPLTTQSCYAFKIEFDLDKLLWEMNYAQTNLLESLCKIQLSNAEKEILQKTFISICQTLDQEPKFISHRDYHSRNLMLYRGKIRVIDFQDARLGPIQYDLVSLLKDSYVNLDSNISRGLLEYYLQEREKVINPIKDFDHFSQIYEIQSIQRCFKACGSFASFYVTRKDTRYLKYLSHTLLKVRESIQSLGKYQELSEILEKYKIFDKRFEF